MYLLRYRICHDLNVLPWIGYKIFDTLILEIKTDIALGAVADNPIPFFNVVLRRLTSELSARVIKMSTLKKIALKWKIAWKNGVIKSVFVLVFRLLRTGLQYNNQAQSVLSQTE